MSGSRRDLGQKEAVMQQRAKGAEGISGQGVQI